MAKQDRSETHLSTAEDTRDVLLTVSPEAATRSIGEAAEHLNRAYQAAHGLEGIALALGAVDAEGEPHLDGYARGALSEAAARLASVLQTDLLAIANMPAVGHA